MSEKVIKSEEEWKALLSPEQFYVCRQKGTERPFSGQYVNDKTEGIYACACCHSPLFHSDTKFSSGTGWPSFWEPISEETVTTQKDESLFMERIEVLCSRCDAHLGHVFHDGPPPTHQRYCINSIALEKQAVPQPTEVLSAEDTNNTAEPLVY